MFYKLIFDKVIVKQLKKLSKSKDVKDLLKKMFEKLELIGPYAGKCLDPKLDIYEIKSKKPALRLYFKVNKETNEIYILQYEIKKSGRKQKSTINRIRYFLSKSLNLFSYIFLPKCFFQIQQAVFLMHPNQHLPQPKIRS